MGKYRSLGTMFNRLFRNDLNANFNDIDADIKAQKQIIDADIQTQKDRVDNLITGTPQPSEVVDARGGLPVLRDRLDGVDANLNSRAVTITQPPYNASAGSDITTIINKAIADVSLKGGGKVFVPTSSQSYFINAVTSIQMKNNVTLELAENTTLEAIATDAGLYAIIKGIDVSNIGIIGRGTIKGERNSHIGMSGEWGMGIDIRGCTNVLIDRLTIRDCWGDAIYIGSSTNKNYCENVTIDKLLADNNRRQGISVISAKNLRILNTTIKNTLGTSPQAGIDIEPNYPTERLEGIFIENYVSENNVYGISLWLTNLVETQNTIDIFVKNFTDNGSTVGVRITTSDAFSATNEVHGNILFDGVSLNNNKDNAVFSIAYPKNLPQIQFKNLLIKNPNTSNGTSDSVNSAISIIRQSDSPSTSEVGNIKLENFSIISKSNKPKYSIYVQDSLGIGIGNVEFINPKRIDKGVTDYFYNGGSVMFEDKYRTMEYDLVSSNTNSAIRYFTNWTNKSATSSKTLTLSNDIKVGSSFTVRIEKAFTVTILPGTCEILPIGNGVGKNISSSKIGSKIKLKKISATQFIVEEIVGVWTAEV
jgi:hypothetical protein